MRVFAFVGAGPIALRAINDKLTWGASLPVSNTAPAVDVRFGSKAALCGAPSASAKGQRQTFAAQPMASWAESP